MIRLDVTFDPTLLRRFRSEGWSGLEAGWGDLCRWYSTADLGRFKDFFHFDKRAALYDPSPLEQTFSFLDSNLRLSVEHITRWLPDITHDISQRLSVVFLPHGRYTFSPKPGLQFFSLESGAALTETYLFLVHVCYHELSALNETPHEKRCSMEQRQGQVLPRLVLYSLLTYWSHYCLRTMSWSWQNRPESHTSPARD